MEDAPLGNRSLARLQEWLGKAISRPLPEEYPANPLAVSSPELRGEADALVREKGGLSGFGRVGIYNQQYWFRLISIMQSEHPCAVHLMGLRIFNEWAARYLEAHPPSSSFLAELDAGFPAFLEKGYRGEAREAVLQAAAYDRALSKAFDAPEGISLAAAGISAPADLPAARLALAPHLTPLRVDWDFADFRAQCLPDESLEGCFELKPETACLVVFRGADLEIMKEPVSRPALAVLGAFAEPATLAGAFEKLEGKVAEEDQAELMAGISGWFRDWVARGWLCAAESPDRDGG
ncbi:MAG TPA: putative DNA-binding domain-containing protein [Fibrobacteria bacterium]|nr:putative DNA-binding domain-containing protein [Fibrobacteria bacterium]